LRKTSGFEEVVLEEALAPSARRSDRMPRFVGMSVDPDARLPNLKAAIVGAGSIGANIALGLARLQIGRLWIADRSQFKNESLLTQPIGPDDVGRPKARCIGEKCKRLSPETAVLTWNGAIQDLGVTDLLGPNAVILATDNLSAESYVAQWTLSMGLPLVHASVHGDTLVAQVRTFSHSDPEGPCLLCSYGAEEFAHLGGESIFSCEGIAKGEVKVTTQVQPTMSVAFLCSTAADLALNAILRHVLQLGQPVWNKQVEFCGFRNACIESPLKRNPNCQANHIRQTHVSVSKPLQHLTLREILAILGEPVRASLAFSLDGLEFVERAECACTRRSRVDRFLPAGAPAGRCACGGQSFPMPYYSHRPVGLHRIRKLLDRPIADIADRSPRSLTVHAGDRAWLVTNGQRRLGTKGICNEDR